MLSHQGFQFGEHMATDNQIQLVVGLGNPGAQYEQTRHNVGFWAVDRWASKLGARFQMEKSFLGEVAKAGSGAGAVWFLKPQTYMNRSGQSVGALARFFKIEPSHVLVIHDELDLLPGQVRLKFGGGHAGHNGLKDIQFALGGPGFWRLRIGIGHPRSLGLSQGVADFVLHQPRQSEQVAIEDALARCDDNMQKILAGDMSKVMGVLHRDPAADAVGSGRE